MSTLVESANLKGVFIPYCDYGFERDEGPQLGEILFHCGEFSNRASEDYDDAFICYRFGFDLEPFEMGAGDGLYFEIFPEIEIASEEWDAWLKWCRSKWEEDWLSTQSELPYERQEDHKSGQNVSQ